MPHAPHLRRALVVLGLLTSVRAAVAQQSPTAVVAAQAAQSTSPYATRGALQAAADSAERLAADAGADGRTRDRARADALRLRRRLELGDFLPGDRVALRVEGQAALTDTFTVRAGNILALGDLAPLPLDGVLRSELASRLTRHIAEFVRDPQVRATPLVRIAVLGEVVRPGFLTVPPDALLSDVVMLAGGPRAEADLQKTSVRRGTEVHVSEADARAAIRNGWTLDALDVRAGDEIVVGRRRTTNWTQILSTTLMALGAVTTVVAVTQ